jgi:hypothetical protein
VNLSRFGAEWIVWAVSAGNEGPPVEGRASGKTIDFFLDEPAGVCCCFSELSGKAGSPGVKPLKQTIL